MKKLVLVMVAIVASAGISFASDYKLNETAIDAAFEASTTISFDNSVDVANFSAIEAGDQDMMGYLLRGFFCGSFALHRSYMGTDGATLWWKYLCIPVVGGVVSCVDFWGVVIKGDEQLAKYKDNPNYIVWGK